MGLKIMTIPPNHVKWACNACTKGIARGRTVVRIKNLESVTYIHDTCFMKFGDTVAMEVGRPVPEERYEMAVSSLEGML